MKKINKNTLFNVAMILLLFSCNQNQEYVTRSNEFDNWPNQEIKSATPESQGVDSEKLVSILNTLDQNDKFRTNGIVVIRNGFKIMEIYKTPYTSDILHESYSCTKSVTSTLIGIAIDQGYIDSVDSKVLDIFPEYRNKKISSDWENITLKHLLTMTSGLIAMDSSFKGSRELRASENWVDYVFYEGLKSKPSDKFAYSNVTSFLLTAILSKQTGMSPLEFARENLFKPLGITNYSWNRISPQGIQLGSASLQLRTEDLSKIGLLFQQKGVWNGNRIVSEEWINEATRVQVEYALPVSSWGWKHGYGYQWWMNGKGNYSARGIYGQFILVSPDNNLVVAINSGIAWDDYSYWEYIMELFDTRLHGSLSDKPLPENSDSFQKLTDKINNWSDELSELDNQINFDYPFKNSSYQLDDNDYKIATITLVWNGTEGKIINTYKSGNTSEIKLSEDGLYQYENKNESTYASRTYMNEDGSMDVSLRVFPSGYYYDYNIRFLESDIIVALKSNRHNTEQRRGIRINN